ncbi:MAG: FAD-dependent oxidoreductase, partial [Nitrososphaerota archaeon]|nr:FAD-dependent oxidoreductase [Nitrososphaerota archaeon]
EFLTRANLMKGYKFPEYDTPLHVGKRVAVIGAGNTAMDSVRTAKRLGAEEAIVVYRRSREEMPARAEEVLNAEEEGIKFEFLLEPIELLSNDKRMVSGIKLMKMKIIESSNGERRAVVPTGDTTQLDVDTVITAVGFNPNPSLKIGTNGLDTDDMGRIKVDGQGRTSLKGVYAGGDIVTGEGTVIEAMGWGRRASTAINEDLSVR